ncbi:MAG: hypothetical protein GF334_08145 [Candidatus Altiarchaeales archaeon]|nr:hypothetical protein [Candidatus Altiarchaeales archaeon]
MGLEELLREVIGESPRGTQTEVAANTELTQSEVANWLRGQRPIPPHKLIQAVDYFIDKGVINIDLEIVRHVS